MIFADVIIDISVKSLDRPFQYIVPEEMEYDIDIGSVVTIPFGMGNRTMTGYVVGLSGEAKFDISKTKKELGYEPIYSYIEAMQDFYNEMKTEPFAKLWGKGEDYEK